MGVFILIFHKLVTIWQNVTINRIHHSEYMYRPLVIFMFTLFRFFASFCTGELGYVRPLYDRFLHMTDDMLGPSPMHIKYSSYVYDGFCI